jgi:hypothetical protein
LVKFAVGGLTLGSANFRYFPDASNMTLVSKVVILDFKMIITLSYYKFVTHSVQKRVRP